VRTLLPSRQPELLAHVNAHAHAHRHGSEGTPWTGRRAWRRGVTLIELLVAIALAGLLTGGMVLGMGAISQSRLKRSASMIGGAIRVAYNYANSTAKPARLVFDFDTRTVTLEQGEGAMLLHRGEKGGGAVAATEAEQEANAAAEQIAQGPRAPRTSFQRVNPPGLANDADPEGKTLSAGIRFRHIEVEHEDEPVDSGRAYLYFWPGGQTERAAIQLMIGADPTAAREGDIITLKVAPLTGKVEIVGGAQEMPRPRSEEEESERDDTGS
jgi:general secretion pathway protein H